jgi:Cof subfamily protein (haloacid dehalogenase superfamily)
VHLTVRRPPATKISAVVSDIDGTLVTDDKVLTDRSQAAVASLGKAGIAFTVISSRPPRGAAGLVKRLGISLPSGCFNGGVIVGPDSSPIQAHLISPDVARRGIDLITSHGAAVWLFSGQDWFLHDPLGDYVELEKRTVGFPPVAVADFGSLLDSAAKIVGVSADPGLLERCEAGVRTALAEAATVVRSQAYYLDITDRSANKGTGVLALSKLMSIPMAEIAVIGDGDNDVAMFGQAGLSIAIGNGKPAAKAAADFLTDGNGEDGFAKAIDRFILGGDRTVSRAAS